MKPRLLLLAYAIVAVVDVVAELAHWSRVADVAQPLLMPLLAGYLVASVPGAFPGTRLVRWTLAGLTFSWLGDVAFGLPVGIAFELGLGCFLIAQVCYSTGYRPMLADSPISRNRWWAAPYVAWWLVLFGVLAPDLGGLMVPVAVYGALLCTMAALATGVHRLTAIGAAVFVVSDSVLAATSLTDRLEFSADGAVVMATYIVGQVLMVLGVIARVRADRAADAAAPVAVSP